MGLQSDPYGNPYGERVRSGRNLPDAENRRGFFDVPRSNIALSNIPSVMGTILSGGSGRTSSFWPQSNPGGSHLPARGDVLTRRAFTSEGTVSAPSVDRPGPRESPVVFGQGVLGNIMKSLRPPTAQGPLWKIWLFKFLNPGGE